MTSTNLPKPWVKQFLWEQWRLMSWMLGLPLCAVLAPAYASLLLQIPASRAEAEQLGGWREWLYGMESRLSLQDAIALSDTYLVVMAVGVVFGALVPEIVARNVGLGMPTRFLRLPLGTARMAWLWIAARTAFVAALLLAVLLVRHSFTHLPSEMLLGPAFAVLLAVFLALQGVARLAAAWNDIAALLSLIAAASALGFLSVPLWEAAKESPWTVLGFGGLAGLPMAYAGIAMRRRGGVRLDALEDWRAPRGARYLHVADIPRMTGAAEAQGWLEWRRIGWIFPALCLVGGALASSGTLLAVYWDIWNPRGRGPGALVTQSIQGQFIGLAWVAVSAATLLALYLFVVDVFASKRPAGRFMMVRPLHPLTFARARLRTLAASVGAGALLLPLFFCLVSVVVLAMLGEQAGDSPSLGTHYLRAVTGQLTTAVWQGNYHWTYSFQGAGIIYAVAALAAAVAAALVFANRYVAAWFVITLVVAANLPYDQWTHDYYEREFRIWLTAWTFMPFVLVGWAYGDAVRKGVLGVKTAVLWCVAWLIAWGVFLVLRSGSGTLEGLDRLEATLYIGPILAIVVVALPTHALAFHATRSGSFLPHRMAGARPSWAEARAVMAWCAAALVVAAALAGTWRMGVRQAVAAERARAQAAGIPLDDGRAPDAAMRAAVLTPETTALFNAAQLVQVKIDAAGRRFVCDTANVKMETAAGAFIPGGGADLAEADLEILRKVSPGLNAAVRLEEAVPLEETIEGAQLPLMPARSLLLVLYAAELRDPALAGRGLQAALRGAARLRLAGPAYQAELWAQFALVLERTLQRLELPAERLATLRAALPEPLDRESCRRAMRLPTGIRVPMEHDFPTTTEEFLLKHLAGILDVEGMAYAERVASAVEVTSQHDTCLTGTPNWRYGERWRYPGDAADIWEQSRRVHQYIHVADGLVALCKTVLAIEEHRARHGRYPEQLSDLVPTLLAAVPVDWTEKVTRMAKSVKYRRANDGFMAYIAGPDGSDNDGLSVASMPGGDIVLRIHR